MKSESLYTLLALAVLALVVGPIGIAVFVLGFVYGEAPCVLCWAQRTGMILIALTGVLILRFGPRPRYIGMGILISAHGLYMAARHSALHSARDVGQGFALEILGAHTYTWSAIIFWCGMVMMGMLLLLMRDGEARGAVRDPGPLGNGVILLFLVAVGANALQALAAVGPPPFMGQGDPIRFSFLPKNWVWSMEKWKPTPLSMRGPYAFERPTLDSLETDWRQGPLADLQPLPTTRTLTIAPALNGPVTDLAVDPSSGGFFVTTGAHGVYALDAELSRIDRYTVLDPGFSVDIGGLVGAAVVAPRTVLVLGHNKSYVLLKEASESVDPDANYRYFLESFDAFEELRRSRFATVRAKMNYVMSVAYGGDNFYTVAVPNPRHPRLVISAFSEGDMMLSQEYRPALAPDLRLHDARSLDEYVVTGLAVDGGRMYAVSAAFSTLLVFDLESGALVDAYGLEKTGRPTGLALRGSELYVVDGQGRVAVVPLPAAAPPAEPPSDG